jgi:uncharacterized alpha/beta hydrolase family protein
MKKVVLAIIISLFGAWTLGAMPAATPAVFAQRKDDRKKDPPGPPVQRDKKGDQRPKDPPPKRDRKPESASEFIS